MAVCKQTEAFLMEQLVTMLQVEWLAGCTCNLRYPAAGVNGGECVAGTIGRIWM